MTVLLREKEKWKEGEDGNKNLVYEDVKRSSDDVARMSSPPSGFFEASEKRYDDYLQFEDWLLCTLVKLIGNRCYREEK